MSELEAALADTGALLVRVQKYQRGAGPEGAALQRRALALGDAARRLHRQDALDAAAARGLLAEAHALAASLRALLAAVRADPAHRAAVEALAADDRAALGAALPLVFAGLEPAPLPPALFFPVPWLRRGRRRPVAEIVAEVADARDQGLPGEGDDLSPGADAELPAVTLVAEPPGDEPICLRLATATLEAPVLRVAATGEYLVHAVRLRAPLAVRLAPELPADEQLRVEVTPADHARWRDELAAALTAAGIRVDDV